MPISDRYEAFGCSTRVLHRFRGGARARALAVFVGHSTNMRRTHPLAPRLPWQLGSTQWESSRARPKTGVPVPLEFLPGLFSCVAACRTLTSYELLVVPTSLRASTMSACGSCCRLSDIGSHDQCSSSNCLSKLCPGAAPSCHIQRHEGVQQSVSPLLKPACWGNSGQSLAAKAASGTCAGEKLSAGRQIMLGCKEASSLQ